LLIFGYLAFDGFTSTTQERLFKSFKMSTNNQIIYVNLTSALLSLMVLSLPAHNGHSSARLLPAFDFGLRNPIFLIHACVLSLSSSLGQLIIYYTIKEFGALVYSTIMTTRQFISILISSVLFVHPLTFGQWLGSLVVFGSLYMKSWLSNKTTRPKKLVDNDGEDDSVV
jgi:adenosine 3'-phospho 5'-phosphosulfate transporter B2